MLAALPWLGGCSTLGIATTGDVEEMQADQQSRNRRTETQLQNMQNDLDSLQTQLEQLEATLTRFEQMTRGDLDSLMTEFREARDELEAMGLDTMADDLATARENTRKISESYLMLLKAEYEALGQQIQEIETMMQPSPPQSPAEEETAPPGSGGG